MKHYNLVNNTHNISQCGVEIEEKSEKFCYAVARPLSPANSVSVCSPTH